ncbi:hypothetical protein GQ457_16G014740 [Hibiscus cannabinus]
MLMVSSHPPSITQDHGQGRALDNRYEAGDEGGSWWRLIDGVSWYPDVGFEGGAGLGPVVGDGYPQGVAGLPAQRNKEALGSSQGVAPLDLGRGAGWYGVGRSLWWPSDGGLNFLDEGCYGRGSGQGPEGGGGCPLGPRFLDVGSVGGALVGCLTAVVHAPTVHGSSTRGAMGGVLDGGSTAEVDAPMVYGSSMRGPLWGALVIGLTALLDASTVQTGRGLREECMPRGSNRVVSVASRTGARTGCGHSGNSRHRSGPWVVVSSVQKKKCPHFRHLNGYWEYQEKML